MQSGVPRGFSILQLTLRLSPRTTRGKAVIAPRPRTVLLSQNRPGSVRTKAGVVSGSDSARRLIVGKGERTPSPGSRKPFTPPNPPYPVAMLQKLRPSPRPCPFLDRDIRVMAGVFSYSCRRSEGGPMRRLVSPRRQSRGSGHALRRVMGCGSSRCLADPGVEEGIVLPASEPNARGAVHAIRSGKVIAVPTDTIYGFACDACSAEAIKKIYEIKGRQETKPLAICVADVSEIPRFALTEHLPPGLLDSLLPGPVTVVLRRGESSILDKSLNPGVDSIGVRVPDCEFIRCVARGSGCALALTSANVSGQPSSVSPKDFEHLWRHCAFIYDGGELPSGRAGSTVVDLTAAGKYTVIRAGSAREETTEILLRFCLRED